MRQMVINGTFAVGLSIVMLVCSSQTVAQSKPSLLNQKIDLHLKNGTLLQVLSTLSVDDRVPIGFVQTVGHKDKHHLNIDLDDTPLHIVLDTVMQQQPEYRWEVRDNVINILPTKSDQVVENLLGTAVQRFHPPKLPSTSRLRDAVIEMPEVQSFLKANGISASRYGYFERSPSIYSNPTVDLNISNVDVRGVLNKIIKESEHKMWIVSRSGEGLTSLDLGF